MIVRCIKDCWDSKRNRRYYAGDQDDVDPLEPLAMYFDFPPGTEVYCKIRGTKTTPARSATRIIPGGDVKHVYDEKPKNPVSEAIPVEKDSEKITCDICGTYTGTELQVRTHKYHCAKKQANA
jgi:hypothetical protein